MKKIKTIIPEKTIYVVTVLKRNKIKELRYFYNLIIAIRYFNHKCNKNYFCKMILSEQNGKNINIRFSLQERIFFKIKFFLKNIYLNLSNLNKKNKF